MQGGLAGQTGSNVRNVAYNSFCCCPKSRPMIFTFTRKAIGYIGQQLGKNKAISKFQNVHAVNDGPPSLPRSPSP